MVEMISQVVFQLLKIMLLFKQDSSAISYAEEWDVLPNTFFGVVEAQE